MWLNSGSQEEIILDYMDEAFIQRQVSLEEDEKT